MTDAYQELADLKDLLPKPLPECGCEKDELGYHGKDCDLSAYAHNAVLKMIIEAINSRMERIKDDEDASEMTW